MRSLKPLKVDSVSSRIAKMSVDIFLDRNDKTFFAKVDLEKIEAPTAQAVKEMVLKKLNAYSATEWRRVIYVHVEEKSDKQHFASTHIPRFDPSISFTFSRREVGKAMNGEMVERPVTEDLDEGYSRKRQEESPMVYAEKVWRGEEKEHIPYTEETWAALHKLVGVVDLARERIAALLNPENGGKSLAALGSANLVFALPIGKVP